MVTSLTVNEVLEKAIQKEIESQNLYTELSQRVVEQPAKDAFMILCREEQRHQSILEQFRRGEIRDGALNGHQIIDYKIAEHLDQPVITAGMKLKDVFLLASNREKVSHEFYLSLAGIHPAGQVRRLLGDLALQELQHKQKVEFLYTEVAFPQTDGG
ncbi:MAG: ferritin family protein [Chloroflexi bacterium]|nr:ferritin family protein [Chloroflexota bacterium]